MNIAERTPAITIFESLKALILKNGKKNGRKLQILSQKSDFIQYLLRT